MYSPRVWKVFRSDGMKGYMLPRKRPRIILNIKVVLDVDE
jgi:hypothetical protein